MEHISFTPSGNDDSDAGDQSPQDYQNQGQAPVNTEPVEQTGIDPRHTHVEATEEPTEVPDDSCPKCASEHIASQMSSPTTSFHECYRCSNTWETKEEDYIDHNTANRSWIMDSSGPGGDDFFSEYARVKAMREAGGQGTRNLSDIARKDPRLQEIHERLEANKRESGRKFTPHEQRQFIDEQGVARNADKLDLEGTHYESHHRYIGEKANGMNAPEEHLFLGL
jgi:DNA-directed RNA polymerase subunit M/transcription elongation factor TFIIS